MPEIEEISDIEELSKIEPDELPSLNWRDTENKFRQDLKYDILVVINYNSNPVKKGRGSAIFLHLTKNYAPTKGCVAMAKKNLIYLLSKIQKNTKIKIY